MANVIDRQHETDTRTDNLLKKRQQNDKYERPFLAKVATQPRIRRRAPKTMKPLNQVQRTKHETTNHHHGRRQRQW
jgi:hypothetical protein